MDQRVTMFLLPFALLGLTRIGAEVSGRFLPMRVALVTALAVYYIAISAAVFWGSRAIPGALSFYSGIRPSARRVALGIVLPALPLCGFFIFNLAPVSLAILAVIVAFAVTNAGFEELFWRGLMAQLPTSDRVRILYSSALFALGHWFVMGAYMPLRPRILIVMVLSTFSLGVVWMWFYLRERSLAYTIASHFAIDVFSLLGVAMHVRPR